jgi:hypothetical protein
MRERRADPASVVRELQEETKNFANLCRHYASHRSNKELKKLRRGVSRNRTLLKTLVRKAEECEGAYQSIVEACRAIALAELQIAGGR